MNEQMHTCHVHVCICSCAHECMVAYCTVVSSMSRDGQSCHGRQRLCSFHSNRSLHLWRFHWFVLSLWLNVYQPVESLGLVLSLMSERKPADSQPSMPHDCTSLSQSVACQTVTGCQGTSFSPQHCKSNIVNTILFLDFFPGKYERAL